MVSHAAESEQKRGIQKQLPPEFTFTVDDKDPGI